MTSRRDFLNRALVGGAAFGLGLSGGIFSAERNARRSRWSLAARVPEGEQRGLEALAQSLGLDLSEGRWEALPVPAGADLVLVRDRRLIHPAEWPGEAVRIRARWAGRHATRSIRLIERSGTREARRAVVVGPTGPAATLDLDHEGEWAWPGRDGRRLVLSLRQGGAEVVEASCRHRYCQQQGRIALAGERLVCAPAGLIVQLEG